MNFKSHGLEATRLEASIMHQKGSGLESKRQFVNAQQIVDVSVVVVLELLNRVGDNMKVE